MQPIIYDVTLSTDGFIAGAFDQVSRFPHQGDVVEDFMARLAEYSCVIMGRRTYEFGYEQGLEPGEAPFPGMQNIVISENLHLPQGHEVSQIHQNVYESIQRLRSEMKAPLYLCGGGQTAGWMLAHGLLQVLRIKQVPVFLGSGVRLFGSYEMPPNVRLTQSKQYSDGSLYHEYEVYGVLQLARGFAAE